MYQEIQTHKIVESNSNAGAATALITGASSGIGLELARLFAKGGYNLVLVARNRPKLENLARELQVDYRVQVTVMLHDLCDPTTPRSIADMLDSQSVEIDVLVNNAGAQVYGQFMEANLQDQLALIQVNASVLVQLTHLLLPGMIRRGRGYILNLGSTGSFAPGPLNSVYCATKAFVLSFSQAIGAELAGTGVSVTTLCPGPTDTAFITRHGMQDVRIFRHAMAPARVAEIGYRAMLLKRPLVVAGFSNRLQVLSFHLMAPFLNLIPPAWLMTIGKFFMGRRSASRSVRIA